MSDLDPEGVRALWVLAMRLARGDKAAALTYLATATAAASADLNLAPDGVAEVVRETAEDFAAAARPLAH